MKILFKIIYYAVIGFVGIVAVLLLISAYPVTENYKVMIVLSGSMEPEIKMGSIVVVKPIERYNIGEVITFQTRTDGDPTTHRINDIKVVGGELKYITKGDANNAPDQREISQSNILGKVFIDIPYLGYLVSFVKNPVGFLMMLFLPALVIIIDEGIKIYAEIKKKKNKSNEL